MESLQITSPSSLVLCPTETEPASPLSLQTRATQQATSRWRVLVVDSHRAEREMLRALLDRYAEVIEVVGEASDGEEAVRLAGRLAVDLILMDINLPNMGGIEATRQIKRTHPDIVVLAIADKYTSPAYNAVIAAGAMAFLRKEDFGESLFRTIVFAMCASRPLAIRA